jgi:WD40 repeat protein
MYPIFSLFLSLSMLNLIQSQSADFLFQYGTGISTAMDMEYSSNMVIFANTAYNLLVYTSGLTGAPVNTINTNHKANITTLSISPDQSLVLTGSKDFTARVYNVITNV